jgi:prophage tail gpP-like protein
MSKPSEIAVLSVAGQDYKDWETVMVRAQRQSPMRTCRFTCSEGVPLAKNWAGLQIKPGDPCSVTLGGQLAMTGTVYLRQVYDDAHRHHIEIGGVSRSGIISTTSATHPTFEWKNTDLRTYINDLLKPVGVPLVIKGAMSSYKFPRINLAPGTTIWEAIDRQSRPFGIEYTSDAQGALVALCGPGEAGGAEFIEGDNILIGREIIYNESIYKSGAFSQAPGDNSKWGADVASVPYGKETRQAMAVFAGSGNLPMRYIPSEVPAFDIKNVLTGRADMERSFNESDQVTVICTVYGWFERGGALYDAWKTYPVNSPMLMMHGESIPAFSVTFTQDNESGTRTTVELKNPIAAAAAGGGTDISGQ